MSYEGRIRPSLIAAASCFFITVISVVLRGANSPLPHCGGVDLGWQHTHYFAYEGRIRPSLIAARSYRQRRL